VPVRTRLRPCFSFGTLGAAASLALSQPAVHAQRLCCRRPGKRAAGAAALQAKMGVRVKVLDPTPGCPASAVAEHTLGSFRDPDMIRRAPGRTLQDLSAYISMYV